MSASPLAQCRKLVDSGLMSILPGDSQTIPADQFGPVGHDHAKLLVGAGQHGQPRIGPAAAFIPTLGTWTVLSQHLQRQCVLDPVGPADAQLSGAVEVDFKRLCRLSVHLLVISTRLRSEFTWIWSPAEAGSRRTTNAGTNLLPGGSQSTLVSSAGPADPSAGRSALLRRRRARATPARSGGLSGRLSGRLDE